MLKRGLYEQVITSPSTASLGDLMTSLQAPESWTAPYTFLGLADFLSVTGSKPMNITWRLHEPIPANFLRETNKLVVG